MPNARQTLIEKFLTGYKITREDWVEILTAYALTEEAARNTTPATAEEVIGGSDNEKFITSFLLDYFWKTKILGGKPDESLKNIVLLGEAIKKIINDTVATDKNTWSAKKIADILSKVDQSPTKDSENPVSSGGVFEELEKKVDKSSLPLGTIVMWSGDIAKIPGGWALCNGENGTPNLRDRFIVGAGGGYHAGATGGANEIVLNVNQMPAHSHGMDGTGGHSHQSSVGFASGGGGAKNGLTLANVGKYEQNTFHSSYIGNHAHNIHNNGGNQAHENRPPYYALYFIMKIK